MGNIVTKIDAWVLRDPYIEYRLVSLNEILELILRTLEFISFVPQWRLAVIVDF